MWKREPLVSVNRDGIMPQALEHLLQCPVLQDAAVVHLQRLCHDSYSHENTTGVTDSKGELANQVESGTAADTITVVIISSLPHIMSLNAHAFAAQSRPQKRHI